MRALLYALLLTNVLFFTWAQWIDAPRPGAHRSTPLLAAAAANTAAAGGAAGTASGTSSGGSGSAATGTGAASASGARLQIARLQRLSSAGLRDAAALADSGQVSVGLFNEQAGADKRAAAVRAAGFEPVIEPRSHSVEQFWLDVNLPADVPLPAVAALATGLNLGSMPQWGSCP